MPHNAETPAPGRNLVITGDITLAAAAIDNGVHALDPRGESYTKDKIRERLSCENSWTNCAAVVSRPVGPPQ
jgi:uncharacterized protein YaiI (UPF0178 family)